jgi:methionyl-tRNA formyltransferase
MRITILTNKDLASCLALNHLIPGLKNHQLNVFLSSRVGGSASNENRLPQALLDLKFYEQDLFLNTVFPIADALALENPSLRSFYSLAEKFNIPISELNRINKEDFDTYASVEPDLVLSIRYGVILKQAAINLPTHGVINLHSGRLPQYKGVMASFRAMLNGDNELGTTLHYIDDGSIDTGRIIAGSSMPINPGRSYLWHVLELYEDACKMMLDTVNRIEKGEQLDSSLQQPAGNYFSFPQQQNLDEFNELGMSLLQADEVMDVAKKFYRSKRE